VTAANLRPGDLAVFVARSRHGDWSDLPTVRRVRRRCRSHRTYRIDALWSDGRLCRYLPTDRLDVLEATR
jgi:hypothetical protein